MPLPDITAQGFRRFTITVAKSTATLVNRSTLALGFRAVAPNNAIVPLQNISITPAENATSLSVVMQFDARDKPNGTPWTIQALPTITDVIGNAITQQNLETFAINIPNNPTPVWSIESVFTNTGATLPSGYTATGVSAPTFSTETGMRIAGTASAGWGVRCVESAPFTYGDGKIVEIDFVAPASLGAVGLGRKLADGGFGDFTGSDSLMWWGTSGNLITGDNELSTEGAGEWVAGRLYRIRFKRVGTNTEVSYSKNTTGTFEPIRTVTVTTPTTLTASPTRVLLDSGYSSEMFVRRVAIS